MKSFVTHSKVEGMVKSSGFLATLDAEMETQKIASRNVSFHLGRSNGYLSKQLKKGDYSVSLILNLSLNLEANLFEPFIKLLPENIRTTQKEKELQQQIEDLQKQLEDLKKERDMLEKIAMK